VVYIGGILKVYAIDTVKEFSVLMS